MIFQDPYSSLNPRMTAGGIIGEPLDIHGVGGTPTSGVSASASCSRRSASTPSSPIAIRTSSRAASASASGSRGRWRSNPDLIVADEPISALDVSIQAQIINLLERLQGQFGLTYLFIAHDLSVVRHISDRIAVMYLGRIVELAASRELNRTPLHPYSVALLSAVPDPGPRGRVAPPADHPARRRPLAGQPAVRLPLPHPLLAPRAARQPGAMHDRGPGAAGPRDRARGRLPLRGGGRRLGRAAPGDRPGRAARPMGAPVPAVADLPAATAPEAPQVVHPPVQPG